MQCTVASPASEKSPAGASRPLAVQCAVPLRASALGSRGSAAAPALSTSTSPMALNRFTAICDEPEATLAAAALALRPCLDAVVDTHRRDVLRGGHASFVAVESADVLCAIYSTLLSRRPPLPKQDDSHEMSLEACRLVFIGPCGSRSFETSPSYTCRT